MASWSGGRAIDSGVLTGEQSSLCSFGGALSHAGVRPPGGQLLWSDTCSWKQPVTRALVVSVRASVWFVGALQGPRLKRMPRLLRERVPTTASKQSVLPKSSLVPGGGYHSQKLGPPCGACWGYVGSGAAAPFLQASGMEVQSFAGG